MSKQADLLKWVRDVEKLEQALEEVEELRATLKAVETALKKGYATPKPEPPKFPPGYVEHLIDLAKRAIYTRWNTERKPADLVWIYRWVKKAIKTEMVTGEWKQEWKFPSKRTVDRCVNWTADPNQWEGLPPCIRVKPGVYMPNPARFEEPYKSQLEQVLKLVRRTK